MPRLYVGNIGDDCRERDVEGLFRGYGKITDISLKGAYGFVQIEERRDAEDAVKDINGKSFKGSRFVQKITRKN